MASATVKKKKTGGKSNSINMLNEPRFGKVRAIFEKRGLGDMPLAMMMRMVLDEWIEWKK